MSRPRPDSTPARPDADRASAARPSARALRTARRLLKQVEQVLHALPDDQCPTRLLEDVRRFNQANGGNR